MFPSTGGRRLVLLIRRTTAAAAAGGTNPFHPQPQPHAARLPHHCYSSAPLVRTPDPDTASYLVASCGLSPAAAAAASCRVRVRSTAKADAVLALLRLHGFSDSQIARLLRMSPHLLLLDPVKVIRPKLEFFASLGFPLALLASKPLLVRSLDKCIVPGVEFLRGILGTDASIRTAVSRHPYGLFFDLDKNMRPAVQALPLHGLTEEAISKLLLIQMGVLKLAPDRIAGIFEDLEALGLTISDSHFVYVFRVLSSLSKETWLRKMALYRSLGVSDGELLRAFKMQPTILLISDESIKKKLRFFLDELKLELSDVMGRPVLISYSLEKTIIPRCAVLSVLIREGKVKRDVNLLRALLGNSKVFSARYALMYADDVPDVVKAYEGKIKFEGFSDRDVEASNLLE